MSKLNNIKVVMDKTLHSVPKFFTKNLIKHKSVKGTKVVKRESLETFHYRRAFYTTTAIILLVSIGIGYGIFAAMNIGMTKDEVKENLMNQFNNNNDVSNILDRKEVNPLTYIFNKDLDNNKVYTFTGAGDSLLEHDVTSNVYHVNDVAPVNIPDAVKRAYSKEDIEANYIKSVGGVELDGLLTGRERSPNTYILKSNFNEQTVYAFTGTENETRGQPVTSNVYHVEDNYPEFVPSTVQRAYSKEDVENNYVRRLKGNTLQGLELRSEVDLNTYVLKSSLNRNRAYTIKGTGNDKELIDETTSILYRNGDRDVNLPQSINTKGYTRNEIESTYIRPHEVNDLEGLETKSALNSQVYTWDHEFRLNTAYTFNGKILTKEAHIVTNNLYYVTDEKPTLIPGGVQRAYTKEDIESNYLLKGGRTNLEALDIEYERNELSNDHVYSFISDSINYAKKIHQITSDVYYVRGVKPTNVPNLVTRAYTAEEVENNYVLKLGKNNIDGINAVNEVNPNSYILKNTLENNYYYENQYSGNNLKVHKFPIKRNDIYVASPSSYNSNNDLTLKLDRFDIGDQQYINAELPEDMYVLDDTNTNLLELSKVRHKDDEIYNIVNEGKSIDISLTKKEVLSLDNKIKLFQKENLDIESDRYGDRQNWSGRFTGVYYVDSSGAYILKYYGFWETPLKYFVHYANRSLPKGARITPKEEKYIIDNLDKYNFRVWVGNHSNHYRLSYGLLLNPDGTEWKGFKNDFLADDYTTTTTFPVGAKTLASDYKWKFSYNKKEKIFSLYIDAKLTNHPGGKTDEHTIAIRGLQIYINPDYTEKKES